MILIDPPPSSRQKEAHSQLFTPEALTFLADLVATFDSAYDQLIAARQRRIIDIRDGKFRPQFTHQNPPTPWQIGPLPSRLLDRRIDIGDCSPAHTSFFIEALNQTAQGVQVDFDDGHCPTWRNQIRGLHNIVLAVEERLPEVLRPIQECPTLMLRPRALNMVEHHAMINGRKVPGAFFDFGLLMFHCGRKLYEKGVGPFFYLSKIESVEEAQLWNRIFVWTQERLEIPRGTIKACILIENILAAFQMEDILFAIREHQGDYCPLGEHALGLNCGIWDYAASLLSKFGHQAEFLTGDRNSSINGGQPFIRDYFRLLIGTCHRHKAIATAGMAAKLVETPAVVNEVKKAKLQEILIGFDGFLIYDFRLVQPMLELWRQNCGRPNQLEIQPDLRDIRPENLLKVPTGKVTPEGLRQNVAVTLLFILHWFLGYGVFHYRGAVEDSATAEISLRQLWQWVRHGVCLGDGWITLGFINSAAQDVIKETQQLWQASPENRKLIKKAKKILLQIVSTRYPIEFITSYLNDDTHFQSNQFKKYKMNAKL